MVVKQDKSIKQETAFVLLVSDITKRSKVTTEVMSGVKPI